MAYAGGAVEDPVLGGGVAAGAIAVGGARALVTPTRAPIAVHVGGVGVVADRADGVALVAVDVVDVPGGGAI